MLMPVVILLGSNLGDRLQNLVTARKKLGEVLGREVKSSAVYSTAAWGNTDQPDFLNQVLAYECSADAQQVLTILLQTEHGMGRDRNDMRWAPRLIDIDLLYHGNKVIDEEGLKVPHPAIHLRRFTLTPLAELYPGMKHPVLGLTQQQLLEQCTDEGQVELYTVNT